MTANNVEPDANRTAPIWDCAVAHGGKNARMTGLLGPGTGLARVAMTSAVAAAIVLAANSALAQAAPTQQPGLAGPATTQPGFETRPTAPVHPPAEQSPLGRAIPAPALPTDPSQYRDPRPSTDQGTGPALPQQQSSPQRLHQPAPEPDLPVVVEPAPIPVEPPKVITPPAPEKLGLGDLTIDRPDWVPADVAWKVNGHVALAQRDTNAALQSAGISASRADVMSTAMVLGGASGLGIGAITLGVPAAAIGAVGGGLVGAAIGGAAGAAAGTLVPVPIVGVVPSAMAGTALGAATGAAVGAAVLGVPAAVAGGAAGGAVGALVGGVATAGDGSDFVAPPEEVPGPGAPDLSLHDQLRAGADTARCAGESAVDWVQTQPGGVEAVHTVASALESGVQAWQNEPMAAPVDAAFAEVASDALSAARSTPGTSGVADAVTSTIGEQAPFESGQLGPLTEAANGALTAAQGLVR
ncbi:hypothetical protein [Nocardia salmonicida]|uniref:hypothetical protein n=1 Tax=Nocardia salmonicida TaxID=53431 RepID=UPI0007A44E60|nr:hypothetical protein [Nocardia salmonicida]